jgi:hypothetical protein
VVLEAAAPVGGLTNIALADEPEQVLDVGLADRWPHADLLGLVDRDGQGELAVDHLEHQVLAGLTEQLALLLLLDHRRTMVGVHDAIADLEAQPGCSCTACVA